MKENGLTDYAQIPKDQKKRMYDEMRTELGKKTESGYKASVTGPDKVPGVEVQFNYKAKFDEAEFKRQLENQQNGMNKLTVEEYLRNRAEYEANGRSKEGAAAQKRAREIALRAKTNEYRDAGYSVKDAEKAANAWIKTQAALHDSDQIAGGNPLNITGMGDARINSSIGSQWKTRIDSIDKYVNELASHLTDEQKKTTYLNVKLSYGGK